MSDQSLAPVRRTTGIPGLDRILDGGLLDAGVYIVQGPPGVDRQLGADQFDDSGEPVVLSSRVGGRPRRLHYVVG